jgi:hypothetical protein
MAGLFPCSQEVRSFMLRCVATIALLLALAAAAPAAAQETTALLSGEELGLPEITIAVSDEGWDAPSELAAGRYLITATYEGERDYRTVAFMQLPDGWTVDDVNQRLALGAPGGDDEATPTASISLTDADISWLAEVTLAGGISPTNGATAQGVIDLAPGNWAIWGDDFTPAAISLTVTGDVPSVQSLPEAPVVIREVREDDGFAFELDGEPASGTQLLEIVNASDQIHFVEFVQLSSPASAEQVLAFLSTPVGLEPDPALAVPSDFQVWLTPWYAAAQSPGTTQWLVTSFAPGSYAMICWLPDPEQGYASHASLGMIATFEVR